MVTKKPASPRLEQPSVRQMGVYSSLSATARRAQPGKPGYLSRLATPPLSNTTIVFAGVALAGVTAALFVAGFARRPITRAYHRVVARAEKIEVPMLFPVTLPVTLADTGRRLFLDLRALPERVGHRS